MRQGLIDLSDHVAIAQCTIHNGAIAIGEATCATYPVAYHYYFHLIITAQSVKGCLSRQGVYTNINGAAIAEGVVGKAGRSRKVKRQL